MVQSADMRVYGVIRLIIYIYIFLKSLIIHKQNTKRNHDQLWFYIFDMTKLNFSYDFYSLNSITVQNFDAGECRK